MRLPTPELPSAGAVGPMAMLIQKLTAYLRLVRDQVNEMSAGSIASSTSATTGPPTTGTVTEYAQGDFIRNNQPTELGVAGAKYIITGWICTAGGKPGTWLPCRSATGN